MSLQKKDFIEIEFTALTKEGEIFDSNIKEDLQKMNEDSSKNITKPFIFCLGEGMFLKGVEDFLIGKEIGKYKIELTPQEAFGDRKSELIQRMPFKVFRDQKLNPIPGVMFNFDGKIAKILTVSGGRVMVDFNNPIAGKDVIYNINILRKLDDLNEKIKAFNEFIFRKDFKFKIEGKKIILDVEKQFVQFVKLFKDKFKGIFDLDLKVKEIEDKKSPQ